MKDLPTMLTCIESTPNQIEKNIKNRKELVSPLLKIFSKGKFERIWIIACGSSNNASQCAKPFMMKYLNKDVKVISPYTFLYSENKVTDKDFIVVISQTGCSTNSIRVLDRLKEMNIQSIGITGNINSDFKDHADIVIDYGVGEEKVAYVTKGVVTLALFLMLFSLEVALIENGIDKKLYSKVIKELESVPKRHQYVLSETKKFYERNFNELSSMNVAYSIGFTSGYGIACESALKVGETIKIPSFAYEAEEYIHGPNLQINPNYSFFFYDSFDESHNRFMDVYKATKSVSEYVYAVTQSKNVDKKRSIILPFKIFEPLLSPLYILPFIQFISYETTERLNCWKQHPTFKDFKKFAESKTKTISRIMNED